ncbi:type II toxin-antitoxin system RelE/ParE family toxin [Methylobacterium sp. J-030]|uniref:type II toxin-antitoxin system RelE/ParE family toxin n=1 Tax=Methylobacterium sp. J-030 TaxID=2836627 RepID=UPI001FB8804F|nr:type II toxin-antitoxin system RelE/ParE family toxin [Methylobacterium sp. J-030]MCJ2069040.1 type II toxin-antitoxin system RelE/ParE family toxin [Methylobacterium sp. J-030]
MAVEVIWTRHAREGLISIYRAIGSDNIIAANRIEPRVSRLADLPRMSSRRPNIRPSTRILVAHPSLILYETVPDTDSGPVNRVNIVTVVDGRRNRLDGMS